MRSSPAEPKRIAAVHEEEAAALARLLAVNDEIAAINARIAVANATLTEIEEAIATLDQDRSIVPGRVQRSTLLS